MISRDYALDILRKSFWDDLESGLRDTICLISTMYNERIENSGMQ